jgi:hypothetical protein
MRSLPNFRYYQDILLEGLTKTTETSEQPVGRIVSAGVLWFTDVER